MKKAIPCKYCGTLVRKTNGICSNCCVKLKLIRKIQRMVKEYKEQLENDNQRTAER
jgi:hypothetical protein